MSDDDSQTREERAPRTDAGPVLSGAERVFVRLSLWQTVLSVVRVIFDGQPMRDWGAVVAHPGGTLSDQVARSTVSGRVLSPDERLDLISVTDPALARQFQAATGKPENSIAYCYCSIFDECWLADSRQDALEPESVDECPDFGDATFQR